MLKLFSIYLNVNLSQFVHSQKYWSSIKLHNNIIVDIILLCIQKFIIIDVLL